MGKHSKGVEIELDKKRHLRYPLRMLRDDLNENSDLVEVLYFGLKHEDPDLTPDQVGEMIDLEMLPYLSEPVKKATGGLVDINAMFDIADALYQEARAEGNGTVGEQTG